MKFYKLLLIVFFGNTSSLFAIIGGESINIQEVPWQVAILSSGSTIGGGVIITPNLVITAKHIFANRNIEDMKVVCGTTNQIDFQSNTYNIYRVMMHNYMDIALIELKEPLQFDKNLNSIDYMSSADSDLYAVGNKALVCGWGIGPDRTVLTGVEMKLIPNEEALSINKLPYYAILPYQFPALRFEEGVGGICNGDSGSPLVTWDPKKQRFVLIGISVWSLGADCPTESRHISVFAKLSAFLDWIAEYKKEIVGSKTIGSYGERYYVKNRPIDSYITWNLSDNLNIINNDNDTITVINKCGIKVANGTIQATFSVGSKSMNIPGMRVIASPRVALVVTMQKSILGTEEIHAKVNNSDSVCYWEYFGEKIMTSKENQINYPLTNDGSFVIKAHLPVKGYSITLTDTLFVKSDLNEGFYIYPNPATNIIRVALNNKSYNITSEKFSFKFNQEINHEKYPFDQYNTEIDYTYPINKLKNNAETFIIDIYDPIGHLVKKVELLENVSVVNVTDLKPGSYIISIKKNNLLIGSQRLIKR